MKDRRSSLDISLLMRSSARRRCASPDIAAGDFQILRQLPEREAIPVAIELGQHVEFCERQAELGVQRRIQRREQLAMQRQQLQPEPGFDLPRDGSNVLLSAAGIA
ncbi:hypothetical protein ACQ5SK_37860 [Bradyrhizobium japonicum]